MIHDGIANTHQFLTQQNHERFLFGDSGVEKAKNQIYLASLGITKDKMH